MQTELNVTLRTVSGLKSTAKNLRKEGFLPAICYGAVKETIPVTVLAKDLKNVLSTDAGEHVLINLKADKDSEINETVAILKDLVKHHLKRTYIHADFLILDMKEPITVSVNVRLLGKARGLKMGGVLDQVRRVVDVKCLPSNIPNIIEFDISDLDLNDTLHVSDLVVPEGVEIVTSDNLSIANITAPTVAKTREEGEEGEEEAVEETAAE